ncbi:MAG: hypothetical protein F7C82_05830 [Desulfurococcales archaeon]|nr:hypothetical protein [Desulfurococcales archaeon]
MGFIRLLHVAALACTYPNRLHEYPQTCYGRHGFEIILPDPHDAEYLSIMQGVIVFFKDPRYNEPVIARLSRMTWDEVEEYGYKLIDVMDAPKDYIMHKLNRGVPLRGLSIIAAPDPELQRLILQPTYNEAMRLVREYYAVHIEYDFVDYSVVEDWCKRNVCRREWEAYVNCTSDCVDEHAEYNECLSECISDKLPKQLRQPIPQAIYTILAGEVIEGCRAYKAAYKVLPEFDASYWRKKCEG